MRCAHKRVVVCALSPRTLTYVYVYIDLVTHIQTCNTFENECRQANANVLGKYLSRVEGTKAQSRYECVSALQCNKLKTCI